MVFYISEKVKKNNLFPIQQRNLSKKKSKLQLKPKSYIAIASLKKYKKMKVQHSNTYTTNASSKEDEEFIQLPFRRFTEKASNYVLKSQEEQVDLSKFQGEMNRLEQRVIREQIEKYEKMNFHKQFPPMLKQIQHNSQKLVALQTKLSIIKQRYSQEQCQFNQVQQSLQEEIQRLEEQLFSLQSSDKLKQDYEKQLLLGIVDSSEVRIKQLQQERNQRSQEKCQLGQQKNYLQCQIDKEKQRIIDLAVIREQIREEFNFVKNCQIEPIHFINLKYLRQFEVKSEYFQSKFIGIQSFQLSNEDHCHSNKSNEQGLISQFCTKYHNLTEKQLDQKIFSKQLQCLNDSLIGQHRLLSLREKLWSLTKSKLQKNNQINIQLLKTQLLNQQIISRQEETLEFQQLLDYAKQQSFCIEKIQGIQSNSNELTYEEKEVVTMNKLQEKIGIQHQENQILKKKLKELTEKMTAQRQINLNLTELLKKVKKQHQLGTDKMIIENRVLNATLEQKKTIYNKKMEINQSQNQSAVKTQQILNKKKLLITTPKYQNQRIQKALFTQIRKSPNQKNQQLSSDAKNKNRSIQKSPQKSQNMQSKLIQLRGRLMRKFQQSQGFKK